METNPIQINETKEQNIQQPADKKSVKTNKKTAIAIVIILILAALGYFSKGLLIAATVDGSPISRLAVIQRLEKTSGKSLLDSLITEKLIQNEAKAKKIVVTDSEVSDAIKKIEDQIKSQGSTLTEALAGEGMTMDELKTQIVIQKDLEKLVADKTSVTDQEVAKYISDNKITVAKGQETAINEETKNEIKSQKISTETNSLIASLKSQAKINYFVNY